MAAIVKADKFLDTLCRGFVEFALLVAKHNPDLFPVQGNAGNQPWIKLA